NARPPKPNALPVLADNIPAELKVYPHWVVWKYTWQKDKWDKPPYNARTGALADVTDPDTWSPFHVALAAYQAGGWDGIGYAPHKAPPEREGETEEERAARLESEEWADPFTVFDWDKCRDPATGEIEAPARQDVDQLGTYSEVSVSGTGVRAIGKG